MRLPTRAIRMLVVTVFPIIATASGPIEPFTEEAIARGVVYNMVGYADPYGRLGYGCGFADLDNDGDQDIIIVGADDFHVGLFENDGSGSVESFDLAQLLGSWGPCR